MALIKLTAIVDNISGKLNGTVFSRNKGGQYMRSKSMPSNPRTSFQNAVRARFGAIAQLWGSLTEAQRDAWRAMASEFPYRNRLGDTKILSGFALHQKLNTNLAIIGQSFVSNPPEPVSPPAVVSLSATANEDGNLLRINAELAQGVLATAYSAVVMATPPLRNGVSNFSNQLREIAVVDNLSSPALVGDEYAARFGALQEGQKIGVAVYTIAEGSGVASVAIQSTVIVEE